jgi:mannose-6-phosphate isomerase-like protein (cupin superfamily)
MTTTLPIPELKSSAIVPITFTSSLDAVMPPGAHVQVLVSPTQGYDCYVMVQRIEPGAAGPALHVHQVIQYYYVLAGQMSIQLGCDQFVAQPGTLICVPAGTPHRTWNAASVDELHMELIAPGPPLASLSSPAEARPVAGTSTLLHALERSQKQGNERVNIELLEWPAHQSEYLTAGTLDRMVLVFEGSLELSGGAADEAIARIANTPSLLSIRHGCGLNARNPGPGATRCLSINVAPAA